MTVQAEIEEQAKAIEQAANESMQFEQGEPAAMQPEQPEPKTAEILQPVLMMAFSILAPNWYVSDGEVIQLSEVYGQLIDKYFPEGLGDYGVEITAIGVTAAIVLPRAKTPRKLEPEPEPMKEAA